MSRQSPDRLLAGEVGKPHGLAGEVYVVPISDDPRRFEPGSILSREDGSEIAVESSHRHGNRLLVRFEGISDRAGADAIRGPLYIGASETRELEADEFWPHDLVGCTVRVDDEDVGSVTDVVPGAAQDLLRISTQAGERLVPFVAEIVVSVDLDERSIVLDPPEGLLE